MAACSLAWGTWSGLSSGGTTAPRSSSVVRYRNAPSPTHVTPSTSSSDAGSARGSPLDLREHLAPARVDHRQRAGCAGRQRVERRDARDGHAARQREAACEREPEPRAGEAARACSDDDRLDVLGRRTDLRQQVVGVGEHPEGSSRALGERLVAGHDRDRRDMGGGVEREDEAHAASG